MTDYKQLDAFIRRFANVMGEIEAGKEALRDLSEEAKDAGFDAKAIQKVVMMIADSKKKRRFENETSTLLEYLREAGEAVEIE